MVQVYSSPIGPTKTGVPLPSTVLGTGQSMLPNLSLTGGGSSADAAAQFGNVTQGTSMFWPSIAIIFAASALALALVGFRK